MKSKHACQAVALAILVVILVVKYCFEDHGVYDPAWAAQQSAQREQDRERGAAISRLQVRRRAGRQELNRRAADHRLLMEMYGR